MREKRHPRQAQIRKYLAACNEVAAEVAAGFVEIRGDRVPLVAVEAPPRRQRRSARHLGEVLVQEEAGDELMPRGDAELLVEVLDVVLDGVWGQDEGLG